MSNLTTTIWSNAGRHEWIIRKDEEIIARSGLIFTSRARATRKLILELNRLTQGIDLRQDMQAALRSRFPGMNIEVI